jgi:hypothetical protein
MLFTLQLHNPKAYIPAKIRPSFGTVVDSFGLELFQIVCTQCCETNVPEDKAFEMFIAIQQGGQPGQSIPVAQQQFQTNNIIVTLSDGSIITVVVAEKRTIEGIPGPKLANFLLSVLSLLFGATGSLTQRYSTAAKAQCYKPSKNSHQIYLLGEQ